MNEKEVTVTDTRSGGVSPYRALTSEMLGWLKVGWKEVPGLARTLINEDGGWGAFWLAVLRGEKKGYDRLQFIENPSVMVVIEDEEGRIAFIETIRTDRPRLLDALIPVGGKAYLAQLVAKQLFDTLMAGTPNKSIELPAGIVDAKDFEGFEGDALDPDRVINHFLYAIARAAQREAEEETGLKVQIVKIRREAINSNTAWFIHRSSIVRAKRLANGPQRLDATEMPKKLLWFTRPELNRLIDEGGIFDARTIAALRLMDGF